MTTPARKQPEVRSTEWFDLAFTPYPRGGPVPADLRELSERFCRAYELRGFTDPMYVANAAALAFSRGDGRGKFVPGASVPTAAAIDALAARLEFAYAGAISLSGVSKTTGELIRAALRPAPMASWPPPPVAPAALYSLVVAVATVVTYQGAVLLTQRISEDGNGLWTLFGGKLDKGDTILSAATRELFEESGLLLEANRFDQVSYGDGVTDTGMPFVVLYNTVELLPHELALVKNKEPHKCAGIRLIKVADLPVSDMWQRDCVAIEKATGITVPGRPDATVPPARAAQTANHQLDEWAKCYSGPSETPGVPKMHGSVFRGMRDATEARAYADTVSQYFQDAGLKTKRVFVVRGPTSTTKAPFEVVDATAGYAVCYTAPAGPPVAPLKRRP